MFNCNGLVVSQLINAEPELIHNLHKDFSFVALGLTTEKYFFGKNTILEL